MIKDFYRHGLMFLLKFSQFTEETQVQIMFISFFFLVLGHPKPKKMLIFRCVGIFEYIILLMLILFLDMCQNS